MSKMPALFIGHGSPMNAIEDNQWSQRWKRLASKLPIPKAILSISAHWMTPEEGIFVDTHIKPKTIHDFYGFPEPLYQIQYPAPGSIEIAQRINHLIPEIKPSHDWGIDHGTWSVLIHLFPEATIPVVQISLDLSKSFQWHYDLAKQLAPLRDEGIMILGSGNIVHNLQKLTWNDEYSALPWAKEFDQWVVEKISTKDHQSLITPFTIGESVHLSIPTPDHYLPLLYILAVQDEKDRVSYPVEGFSLGSLSMRSILLKY